MFENDFVALEGPVERRGEHLVLRVPLAEGGEQLKTLVAQMNAYEEDGRLVVILPNWLAERMHLHEGTPVHVDTRWGKLNIARLN